MKRALLALVFAGLLLVGGFAAPAPAGAGEKVVELPPAREMVVAEKQAAVLESRHQQARIAEQRRALQAARKRAAAEVARLRDEISRRERELEELAAKQERLRRESHKVFLQLDELAGVVRTGARDLLGLLENSPVSGDRPGRLEPVKEILARSGYPGMAEIRTLADLYLGEMRASGEIRRREGEYIDLAGRPARGRIVRLGALGVIFAAPAGEPCGYAVYGPENDSLLAVSRPGWWIRRNLREFVAGETGSVYLDFSGGSAVRRLALMPTAWERLRSGGFLVWPILLIGLVALGLSAERFIFLSRVKSNTDRVMGRIIDQVGGGDFSGGLALLENRRGPVFRVLRAGLKARHETREILEHVLEEAILKELPQLEKFLPTLQVLAAIAPLLGLLGTVTGMINTFQVITVYGAGDPRMMSGGISEALMTTMLGLSVAIPIILLHTWFSRRVDTIIGDMEEKAVSLTIVLQKNSEAG